MLAFWTTFGEPTIQYTMHRTNGASGVTDGSLVVARQVINDVPGSELPFGDYPNPVFTIIDIPESSTRKFQVKNNSTVSLAVTMEYDNGGSWVQFASFSLPDNNTWSAEYSAPNNFSDIRINI